MAVEISQPMTSVPYEVYQREREQRIKAEQALADERADNERLRRKQTFLDRLFAVRSEFMSSSHKTTQKALIEVLDDLGADQDGWKLLKTYKITEKTDQSIDVVRDNTTYLADHLGLYEKKPTKPIFDGWELDRKRPGEQKKKFRTDYWIRETPRNAHPDAYRILVPIKGTKDGEKVLKDKREHGGKREKRCKNCGRTSLDIYELQHCRVCGYNHFEEIDVPFAHLSTERQIDTAKIADEDGTRPLTIDDPQEGNLPVTPPLPITTGRQVDTLWVEEESPPLPQKPAREELSMFAQWVDWRYGSINLKTGKRKKPPFDAKRGANAGSSCDYTNPSSWASHEQAYATWQDSQSWKMPYEGLGFVAQRENGYTFGDLDKCRNPETGVISDQAQAVITAIHSYTEISPSKTGLRFIVRGSIPANVNTYLGDLKIELYVHDHYVTITDEQLPGTPNTIEDRQAEITALYEQISPKEVFSPGRDFPPAQDCASIATLADDQALLERALKDDLFATLMAGDIFKYHGGNWSSADLALCRKLKFYTDGDRLRMDTLFRQSGLMRPKWDEVHYSTGETYGQHTIALVFDDPPVHTKPSPETAPALTDRGGAVDTTSPRAVPSFSFPAWIVDAPCERCALPFQMQRREFTTPDCPRCKPPRGGTPLEWDTQYPRKKRGLSLATTLIAAVMP